MLRLLGIFAAVVFWALFDQKGSSWVLQARRMELGLWGRTIDPAQLQALNPFLIMALIIPLLCTWGFFPSWPGAASTSPRSRR